MDYFEVYYAYLAHCRKVNWANDIDPNHNEMEWHHILPQCLFGDQPCGQWLSLKQHAIASALQTLAFSKKCFCAWHCKHIPSWLWKMAHERIFEEIETNARKGGIASRDQGVGVFAMTKSERAEVSGRVGRKSRDGKTGIHGATPEERREWAVAAAKISHEMGVGIHAMPLERKQEIGSKVGKQNFENKVGIHSLSSKEKAEAGAKGRSVQFKCLVTGYISNGPGLSSWQRARGIDTSLRERIE